MDLEKRRELKRLWAKYPKLIRFRYSDSSGIYLYSTGYSGKEIDWVSADTSYVIDPFCEYVRRVIVDQWDQETYDMFIYWVNGGELEVHFINDYDTDDFWTPMKPAKCDMFEEFFNTRIQWDVRIKKDGERPKGSPDFTENDYPERAIDIRSLHTEIKRLKDRLEVDEEHGYDGIACRDETIKGQDKVIDQLRANNKELMQSLMTSLLIIESLDKNGQYGLIREQMRQSLDKMIRG